MQTDRSFGRVITAALVSGFLILTLTGGTAAWLVHRNQSLSAWVAHTYEVEKQIADVRVLFERAEAARRGYLLNRGRYYDQVYTSTRADLPRRAGVLPRMIGDNPEQQGNAARLRSLLDRHLLSLDANVALARRDLTAAQAEFQQSGIGGVAEVRAAFADMVAEEDRLLARRIERQSENLSYLLAVMAVSAGLLAVLAAGTFWAIRRYARDLSRSKSELRRLNEGLEQAVRERTADLTRANEEIQRFAYIVSHDLRAPLVNVMGFTAELEATHTPLLQLLSGAEAKAPEVVTAEVRTAIREDLPEAVGFIRTSTAKMDRLINAILALSRQGRRVLNPVPLDMNDLLGAVADTLKQRAADAGAQVHVEPGLPGLVSDRLAVEQVFANLMENAIKYAKPGRGGRVMVHGREEGDRLVFEVEDDGRGIDPKDHERIFELFRRSGMQDQPGEGLGLANVRALVHRLGGAVSCVSTLGQGATFRVSLPRTLQPASEPAS